MGNQNQELQVCSGLQHLFNVRHAKKHANTACSTSSSSDSGRSAGATKPVPDIKTQHLQSAAQTVSALNNCVMQVLQTHPPTRNSNAKLLFCMVVDAAKQQPVLSILQPACAQLLFCQLQL
jgi:hypothetical protein